MDYPISTCVCISLHIFLYKNYGVKRVMKILFVQIAWLMLSVILFQLIIETFNPYQKNWSSTDLFSNV